MRKDVEDAIVPRPSAPGTGMILSLMVHQTSLAGFDRRSFWRLAGEPINTAQAIASGIGIRFLTGFLFCFALN
jgi:hypothetical protein